MPLVVPGTAETLQLVDGSSELPVMRAIHGMTENSLALAAPALAYAADMIEFGPPEEYLDRSTNLRRVLSHCKAPMTISDDPAPYRFMQFGLPEISLFTDVVRAWRSDRELPVAPLLAETITIALANDLAMLLLATSYHGRVISLLERRRAAPAVLWI